MNIVFWIIMSIDLLILILHYAVSIEAFTKNKMLSKIKEESKKNNDKSKESIPKEKLGKSVYIVLTIIALIIVLALVSSIIWIPLTLLYILNWRIALISFMLILALLSYLMILIYNKYVPEFVIKEGAIIKESIYITFFILISIFLMYGPLFPLEQTIEKIFLQSTNFTFTLSILMPVLIIGLLITNVYLFVNGLYYIVDKSKNIVKARTKIVDILTIFTISSFFALFFIIDREWSFLNVDNSLRFYETVDLFKNILFAVLVPLIISKVITRKSDFNKCCVDNSNEKNKNNDNREGSIEKDDANNF
ncbi:MAG: hypothetical protein PHQ79_04210 [Bacilli bacterium]|nr:hypothetical protein [Bacilli bacterium]